jgi:hypothetical protein
MNFSREYRKWWEEEVILQIGPKRYTRRQCVTELGCPNFRAIKNLDRALGELHCTSIRQLHQLTPHELMALNKVGERAVFAAMCVVDTTRARPGGPTGDGLKWLHSDEKRPRAKRTPHVPIVASA